ncbi:MAG: hypothetical protein RIQ59_390 [Bacteroidota bacterium]|jgi:hypothetical protein
MTNVFKIHHYRLSIYLNSFLKVDLAQKKIRPANSLVKSLATPEPNLQNTTSFINKVCKAISKSVIELESINNNLNNKSILLEPTILVVLTFIVIKSSKNLTQI